MLRDGKICGLEGLWFFLVIYLFWRSTSHPFSLTKRKAWAALWNVNKKHHHLLNMFWNLQTADFGDLLFSRFLWSYTTNCLLLFCFFFLSMMSWCLRLWPQSWGDFTSTLARCSSERPLTQRERGTRWHYLNMYITEHRKTFVYSILNSHSQTLKWFVIVYIF